MNGSRLRWTRASNGRDRTRKVQRRPRPWLLGGTRHGNRIIGATLGFPDGSTPNLRRCFTSTVLPRGIGRYLFGLPFRYFRRYPSALVTKTPETPLYEGYASFTDGVLRVMPLKRFLFRSPFLADTSFSSYASSPPPSPRPLFPSLGDTRRLKDVKFKSERLTI